MRIWSYTPRRTVCRTGRDSVPQQIESCMYPRRKRTFAGDGPDQQGAKNCLSEYFGNFFRPKLGAYFTALLGELDEARKQRLTTQMIPTHSFAHRRTGEIALQQRANYGRIASGFLGHAHAEGTKECGQRSIGFGGLGDKRL